MSSSTAKRSECDAEARRDLGRWRLWLAAIVLCGLAFRAARFEFRPHVGNGDQVTYTLMGERIANRSNIGNVHFPPGYPALIAAAIGAGVPCERAGQVVCVVLGTVTVALVGWAGRFLYGSPAGLYAASICAFHPEALRRSSDGMSEAPFTFLLLSCLSLLMIGLTSSTSRGRIASFFLAGICIASARLVRSEGIAYFAILCASLLVMAVARRCIDCHMRWRHVMAFVLAFIATQGVYSWVLHGQTGRWQLVGKRLGRVATYATPGEGGEALRGALSPEEQAALSSLMKSPKAVLRKYVHNSYVQYLRVLPRFLDPLLIVLLALGLFGEPWTQKRKRLEPILAAPWAMLLVFPVFWVDARFLVPLLPIALLWAGKGIDHLGKRAGGSGGGVTVPGCRSGDRRVAWAMMGLLFLLYAKEGLVDPVQARYNGELEFEEKYAGLWLASEGIPGSKVFNRKTTVPFYARMTGVGIPYGATIAELAEIARREAVRYLVISERYTPSLRPTLAPLLDERNAPDGLRLVHKWSTPPHWDVPADLLIYEFTDHDHTGK